MAVIEGSTSVIGQQIVFPQQNFGWLFIPKLPAGEYTLYVQFKDMAAADHGFETIYMSTYGK